MAYHIPMHGNRKPMPEATKKKLAAAKKAKKPAAKLTVSPSRKRTIHPVAQLTNNEIAVGAAISHEKFVIFDLDGCVSNDAWRFGFVQDRANNDECFEHYHGSLHLDEPLDHGAELLRRCIASGFYPVFITARPEAFRDLTAQWLNQHFGLRLNVRASLLMRGNGDPTPTVEVKRRLMHLLTAEIHPSTIVAAYDDRADVVTMYNCAFGVNAFVLDKDGLSDPLKLKDFKSRRLADCMPEYANKGMSPEQAKADDVDGLRAHCGVDVRSHMHASMDAAVAGTSAALRKGDVGGIVCGLDLSSMSSDFTASDDGLNWANVAPIKDKYAHPASASLAAAIDTLEDRAGRYGRADLVSAQVAATLFPNGLTLDGRESSMRMGMMLFHVIGKLSRFAGSGMKDRDSVHDMINYTAFMDDILRYRENEGQTEGASESGRTNPPPVKF